MLTNKFAMVVDGYVFDVIEVPTNSSISERWIAGMNSDPIFIKCNLLPEVCAGSRWDGSNFFLPGLEFPEVPLEEDPFGGDVKYAAIVDGDVFGMITYDNEVYSQEQIDMLDAAMQSSPKVIPVEANTKVLPGWNWDGEKFIP